MLTRIHTFKTALILILASLSATGFAAQIRVHYDTGFGHHISIRGAGPGLSWSSGQGATWTTGNVWVYNTPDSGGAFEFKPLFNDSTWSIGGNYSVPSGDAVIDIYPFFSQTKGQLVTVNGFYSSYLNNTRSIRIYLPPSYSENTLKYYPVIYMQDGQNLFSKHLAFGGVEWQVDETSDALVAQGRIKEAIIVGIDNAGGNRINEYTPTGDSNFGGGDGDRYLDFIQYELVPYIEQSYRALSDVKQRYLMGSSLGGLISFHAGFTRDQVFGKVACLSSSFFWDNEILTQRVEQHQGPLPNTVFYLDVGAQETALMGPNENMRIALENQGFIHGLNIVHYIDPNGSHSEFSWRNRLYIPLEVLLAP